MNRKQSLNTGAVITVFRMILISDTCARGLVIGCRSMINILSGRGNVTTCRKDY